MDSMIRIGIIAAEPALQVGLRTILSGEGFDIVGEAFSLNDFQAVLPQTDVLVITTETTSPEELSLILHSQETVAILLLTAETTDLSRFIHPFEQRAWGILPLDSSPEELRAAILAIVEGLVIVSPALLSQFLSNQNLEPIDMTVTENEKDRATPSPLTGRESQVLHLLAQGLANKQIALSLGVSERTVKFHISGIFTKLGVASRTEAVRVGVRQGMITL